MVASLRADLSYVTLHMYTVLVIVSQFRDQSHIFKRSVCSLVPHLTESFIICCSFFCCVVIDTKDPVSEAVSGIISQLTQLLFMIPQPVLILMRTLQDSSAERNRVTANSNCRLFGLKVVETSAFLFSVFN